LATQCVRRSQAGCASSNDHYRGRRRCCRLTRLSRRRQLLAHKHAIADELDPPTWNRVECRRAQRLAGAQAETSVVQRAANFIAYDQPLRKRSAVVSTSRTHGEVLVLLAYQENFVTAQLAGNPGLGSKPLDGNPLRKIESRLCMRDCHRSSEGRLDAATPFSAITSAPD